MLTDNSFSTQNSFSTGNTFSPHGLSMHSERFSMGIEKASDFTDKQAYEAFFEETLLAHRGMIARVVSSYERSRALQEELFQEISVALWKALSKFDHQSSMKTYILSIAHKRSVSHVARCVREPNSVEIDTLELQGDVCPSEQMAKAQRMQKMMTAIHQLPLVERQLVTLALEGISYKDIAEILGITISNVGAKLNRAKSKLTQLLNAEASV